MIDLQKYYDKYGKICVFLVWLAVTLFSILFALQGKIDFSWVLISFIGWGTLALYYLLEYAKKKYCDKNSCLFKVEILSKINYRRVNYILNTLYLSLFICLLNIIWLSEIRSILYFLLIVLLAIIIVVSIFTPQSKIGDIINILKIFSLSLLTSLAYFKFFYWGSSDSWEHAFYNVIVRQTGEINAVILGKEAAYPIQHIAVSIMDLLSLSIMDIHLSTILSIIIPSILVSIILYQVSKKIFGIEFACLSLLIFNLSFIIIRWRIWGSTVVCRLFCKFFKP